jgi:hypothetical protein
MGVAFVALPLFEEGKEKRKNHDEKSFLKLFKI